MKAASTLTLRQSISGRPPLDLATTARTALQLRLPRAASKGARTLLSASGHPPIVIVSPETTVLKQRVAELEAALGTAQRAATERARREDRVASITIREVDNTAAYAAKLGRPSGPARVVITTQHVDVA